MSIAFHCIFVPTGTAQKPVILQDIGNIENDALTAAGDEFREAARSLNELLRNLKDQGIITPQNCAEFLGKVE